MIPDFYHETDNQAEIDMTNLLEFIGLGTHGQGRRSDRVVCEHRDQWTETIEKHGLLRPTFSRYNNTSTVRRRRQAFSRTNSPVPP